MSSGNASLQPTYVGHVATTHDALILFEACLTGQLHHVPRRPHDRERNSLIRSGCVFIYEENASGIKRWTDGVPWSPSRILGNFLVYRELLKPFPPGEKKRATKRSKRLGKPGEPYNRQAMDASNSSPAPYSPTTPSTPGFKLGESFDRETERSLIGSLVDSYGFKEGGLVKKTMSVNVNGVHHHLVSYYKVEDALNRTLETPSVNSNLRFVKPRHELTSRQNFRAPLDEMDEGFEAGLDGQRHPYDYADRVGFDRRPLLTNNGYSHAQQSTPHSGYGFHSNESVPYTNGAHQHPAQPGPASYGASTATPVSEQPYYTPAAVAHLQPKSDEFGVYGAVTPYPPRFEPLSNSIGPLTGPGGERGPPPPQPMAYSPQHLRARSGNGPETPTAIKTEVAPESYSRGYYSASRPENAAPSAYTSAEPHRWGQSSTASRAENTPAAYQPEKGAYWPMTGNVAVGHAHYPNSSPVPQWSHPTV
ncbi:MAG: hypothetical protein M1833_005971 [Piccolia ochrophora]|nr:MAG: hypothetical protein M1833_005971 [Piccolia ochrophora]